MTAIAPRLYLASASPRRRELLTQLNYPFAVLSINVPEQQVSGESAEAYVERLAADKARAGWHACGGTLPVLGADTIVVLDGHVLEKPRDQADAERMLAALSGRTHQVMTAVAVAAESGICVTRVTTEVTFRALSADEIVEYWHTGEPADKAGSYGIQGIAGKFVSRIVGSYTAVVGLPLLETDLLLQQYL
ncbi:MAG: septum formation inhibitor Maf [Aeromonadaceae bacterium]|nr:septum formation inhibitor Maf [Aeromonadaceae bacterium]